MSTDTEIAQLKEDIEDLKELYATGALNDWEEKFAYNVCAQWLTGPLSEGQINKIREIVDDHDK